MEILDLVEGKPADNGHLDKTEFHEPSEFATQGEAGKHPSKVGFPILAGNRQPNSRAGGSFAEIRWHLANRGSREMAPAAAAMFDLGYKADR